MYPNLLAAHGRKAEVNFEAQSVIALHHVVLVICELHTGMVEEGTLPDQQYRISANFKFTILTPNAMQNLDAVYLLPFKYGQPIMSGRVPIQQHKQIPLLDT